MKTHDLFSQDIKKYVLCKWKDRVAAKRKNNIVYEIYCSNCEALCFESLKSSSDKQRRSVRNCDHGKKWNCNILLGSRAESFW